MRIQEFSPYTSLLLHWARHLLLGILPFISDPGKIFVFLLNFREFLALCAKSRGFIYTILVPKVE